MLKWEGRQARDHCSGWCFNICDHETTGHFKKILPCSSWKKGNVQSDTMIYSFMLIYCPFLIESVFLRGSLVHNSCNQDHNHCVISVFRSLRLSNLTLEWSCHEQPPRLVAAHLTFKVSLPFSPREHESLKTLSERTSDGSPLTSSLACFFFFLLFFLKCAAAELNVEKENMCRKTCTAVIHTHTHTHTHTHPNTQPCTNIYSLLTHTS